MSPYTLVDVTTGMVADPGWEAAGSLAGVELPHPLRSNREAAAARAYAGGRLRGWRIRDTL
jgi:hypothetical protein